MPDKDLTSSESLTLLEKAATDLDLLKAVSKPLPLKEQMPMMQLCRPSQGGPFKQMCNEKLKHLETASRKDAQKHRTQNEIINENHIQRNHW